MIINYSVIIETLKQTVKQLGQQWQSACAIFWYLPVSVRRLIEKNFNGIIRVLTYLVADKVKICRGVDEKFLPKSRTN
ncbi:hypothetical protein OA07_04355 [Aphanizomenon flos-aquae 2012/KM1/D3]|nr:hypothetical protein OA07_04335 [Aphanizomenon flos-aquae 2012/KM1/D3]KHG42572.1 hypothetical protein OA07_04355 [Aphanizomenon flos-aquae 2012/KM1/D3]